MIRLALILAFTLAPAVAADFGDFARPVVRTALFEDEPAPAVSKGVDKERKPPGEFALSFWGCPVTRFQWAPSAYSGGVGLSFDYRPCHWFAISSAFGGWMGKVSYREQRRFGHGPTESAPLTVLETSVAPRFHPIVWNTGSVYGEIRLSYSVADGPDPVLRTQSWGVDHYFGFELGIKPGFFFGEFGFGARVAFFRKKGGWVGTPETLSGEVGGLFELMRFGLRWYF